LVIFQRRLRLKPCAQRWLMLGRVYGLTPGAALDLKIEEVPDRDWLAEWKKGWQPIKAGRFIVAPPWIEQAALGSTQGSGEGLIIIRIEPGMAFGTGTHETTRLCLKAIEKHFRGGSFLDVGTGTGILAIAAAKMFADARIEACDTDAEAIEIAKDNARLNEAAGQIEFRVGSVGVQTASADLVCANLTAPVIVELLPSLLGATCGRLVLSGVLDTQAEMVQRRLAELGATILETDQDGNGSRW
jgi:ribosomal protein L11 methyltransferase